MNIKDYIKKLNIETNNKWLAKGDEANKDYAKESFFTKWCYVQHEMEKRKNELIHIQHRLRNKGFDIKMNMQNYELSYYGRI